MSGTGLASRLDQDGPAAPPRANGELVFEAPWQGRAFGLVMNLAERGVIDYEDFRAGLIRAISAAEREDAEGFGYYDCWLRALEQLLASRGLLAPERVDALVGRLARRPHGHDHHRREEHDTSGGPASA